MGDVWFGILPFLFENELVHVSSPYQLQAIQSNGCVMKEGMYFYHSDETTTLVATAIAQNSYHHSRSWLREKVYC